MFMLYGVLAGLALGLLSGGRPDRLGRIPLRWPGLAIAGLAVQVALFAAPVADRIGSAGPPLYVASTAVVLLVVLRNVTTVPGLPIVAVGAGSNLLAIVANGGYMPTTADALRTAGAAIGPEYSNSAAPPSVALAPLTDVFALPEWVPLANVFSIGDVLISIGIVVAIVVTMRRPEPEAARPAPVAAVSDRNG